MTNQQIFIGTYTKDGTSQGIYTVQFDGSTGQLSVPEVAAVTTNPSFLAWHPTKSVLYALGEGIDPEGKTSGGVAAFAYDAATGKLTPLNARGACSSNTTHLVADATGKMLIAISYSGSQVATFPILDDGSLGERVTLITHDGPLGPNKERQDKPHPHSVTLSPDNRFAFVADHGLDRVLAYKLDPATATLTPHNPAFLAVTPGSGPRHSKFSRDGKFFYIFGELDASITACAYDATRGVLTPLQHISTLPAGFVPANSDIGAEVRIHPNGKFLYASNRGHDSIAAFAIQTDGTLQLIEIAPCGGSYPRNFNLSPDGAWLVCANMSSNNLASFSVDPATGKLTPTGSVVTVPQAVCVLFTEQ